MSCLIFWEKLSTLVGILMIRSQKGSQFSPTRNFRSGKA